MLTRGGPHIARLVAIKREARSRDIGGRGSKVGSEGRRRRRSGGPKGTVGGHGEAIGKVGGGGAGEGAVAVVRLQLGELRPGPGGGWGIAG